MHIPGGINLIVIFAVALLVFGPNKLPEIARTLARTLNEFRGTMHDVTQHLDLNTALEESHTHSPGDRALSAPAPSLQASYGGATPSSAAGSGPETNVAPEENHSLNIG